MSRRGGGYAASDVYSEHDYYTSHRDREPPRRDARTVEYDEIDIRERRRAPVPEPEFLREDYGRRSEAGPLVIRERSRSRERPRRGPRSEVEEREEIIIRDRSRERPRRKEVVEDEVIIEKGRRERDRPREREYEEVIYRPERERELPPPQIRSEREEYIFRAREREREREPIRAREPVVPMPPPPIRYEREEYEFRPKIREPSPEPERTEISIRERERERPRYREERDEEIIIRRDERSREPPVQRDRGFEEDQIIIRERDGPRRRPRATSYERDSLAVSSSERDKPRARSSRPGRDDFREEEVIIRRGEGGGSGRSRAPSITPSRGAFRDEEIDIRINERERERPRERPRERSRDRDEDDIIFRHNERGGRHSDEIIIRRQERSPSPEPIREPIREVEPVRAPPIHQEIVTHHRHIDHGFERAPEPPRARSPPRHRSPSPVQDERIEIRHSGSRNGRHYDDDIVFQRETNGRRLLDGVHRGRGREEEEEVHSSALIINDTRDRGRRFEAQTSSRDRMWTEITRDLVSEEAIKEKGYEFEETPEFYYVMEYLRYEDVLALVDLANEIKHDRRRRIREMEAEREFVQERPRRPLALGPAHQEWDEERVVEREVIYDGPPRRGYR